MYKLFHGKEGFLSYREAKRYLARIREQFPQYAFTAVDCETSNTDQIVQTYKTVDMFSSGKIVFLNRLSENKAKEAILEDIKASIIDSPSDLIILIIWEDQKIASNTKFFKAFNQSKDTIYESPELNKRTFITWATEEIKNEDIKIDKSIIYELARRADYQVERFINEIEKLKLADSDKIDLDFIKNTTQDTYENTIWNLIDKLNSTDKNDKGESVKMLESLMKSNVDPIFIHAMITRNIRQLLLVKYLLSHDKESKEIASLLRIPPFTVPQLIHKAQDIPFKKLTLIYEKLSNLDYEMKIGNIDSKLGLTLLLSLL